MYPFGRLKFPNGVGGFGLVSKQNTFNKKKPFAFGLILLWAGCAFGQAPVDLPPQTLTRSDISTNPISILPSLGEGRNYVNVSGFANAVFDTSAPVFQSGTYQGNTSGTGVGFELGGGVTASHITPTAQLLLGYTGGFRDYTTQTYPSGTNQNLSLYATKILARRWTLNLGGNAGIFLNGGNAYQVSSSLASPNVGQGVVLNPFSQNTKYVSSSVSLSYQQSLRWSYTIGGDFFLSRYYGNGAFGSTGGDGVGSITYRLTRVTSLSGSYSHSYYGYQNAGGSSSVDSVFATLSHDFRRAHWRVGASGGVARVNSQGAFFIPGFLPASINQQLTSVITQGTYKTTSTLPSFQGSASRNWKHTALTLSGGQSINSGNGIYLTSRNLFLSGFYSIAYRNSSLSFGGSFSRLSSIANTISTAYESSGSDVSYYHKLTRYFGVSAHYDLTYYSNIGSIGGRIDNRVSGGLTFNSSDIPFSYF
jgi:hypothetical protein